MGELRLIISAVLLFWGCQKEVATTDDDKKTLKKMEVEIMTLISDKSCSNKASCAYIAFGSKPCGGPYKYLIYSSEKVDTEVLNRKVSDYNKLQDAMNKKYGAISDCSIPVPPAPECVQGQCRELEN